MLLLQVNKIKSYRNLSQLRKLKNIRSQRLRNWKIDIILIAILSYISHKPVRVLFTFMQKYTERLGKLLF